MAKETGPAGDHPISRAVALLRDRLSALAEVPFFSMGAEETAATLVDIGGLVAQAVELELRAAAHAEEVDVASTTGATSTANWWAHATRQDRRVAAGRMRLADALGRFHLVRGALAAGGMSAEQARVITSALDALPDGLDPDVHAKAEAHLVAEAAHHDPKALRIIAQHLLTVVAPQIGEELDARALERQEREAAESAWMSIGDDGHGSTLIKAKIPALHGAMLRKALHAIAAPKHQRAVNGAESYQRRPSPERLGAAFTEYIERYPADQLPRTGGVPATVVALTPLQTLLGGLKAAHLDTGEAISPSLARRLACEAGIIPAVLGTHSQVLDLGRRTRFHTEAQRLALLIEQTTCTTEGCDWPAHLCHVHHDQPWSEGGTTNTRDARLLCPRHHARIHDPTYQTRPLPGNKVSFHRRT